MATDELRDAIRQNEILDSQARRLARALESADLDRLREAIDAQDVDGMAQALGWSAKDLRAFVSTLELEALDLAEQFPELRELARRHER